MKFDARSIWNLPRAGNQAGQSNLIARAAQNHPKFKKLENSEKQQKTEGFIIFSTLKMNFRSADAANHVNRDPGGGLGLTRRAYIARLYVLKE